MASEKIKKAPAKKRSRVSKKTVAVKKTIKKNVRKKNAGLRGSSSQSFLSKSIMFLILVIIGASLTFYIIKKGLQTEKDIESMKYNVSNMMARSAKNSLEEDEVKGEFCEKKSYSGKINVSAWYEKKDDDFMLKISDKDLKKLPNFNDSEEFKVRNSELILVDASDVIKEKLKKASRENPEEIMLKGYGISCEGNPLVSLETGDNIFTKI